MMDWLIWLWRLRNPMICAWKLETQGSGGVTQSRTKGPGTRAADIWGQGWIDISAQSERGFTLPLPFSPTRALNGLVHAHLLWGGPSAFLSLVIQMLISSGSPHTHLETTFTWVSLSPVRLAWKSATIVASLTKILVAFSSCLWK